MNSIINSIVSDISKIEKAKTKSIKLYLKRSIISKINRIIKLAKELSLNEFNEESLNALFDLIKNKESDDYKRIIKDLSILKKLNKKIINFEPIELPSEINELINEDLKEAYLSLKYKNYRSSVMMMARCLEIMLHYVYFKKTGIDLASTAQNIGLGKLIAKLKEKNIEIPGLYDQIHLINNVRIYAVHKKQKLLKPTEKQAKAMYLFTCDSIEKLNKFIN